jgi:perosamine synthetase
VIPHSRPDLGPAEQAAAHEVIRSGLIFGGGGREAFTRAVADMCGCGAVGLFSSGRSAITAGLAAFDLPRGSEVIVQTYVCGAVAEAVVTAGHVPVFCDIDESWFAGPTQIRSVLSSRSAAIILAPPFGLISSAKPFRDFGLPILHDLCQASPEALFRIERADLGNLIALSFHPTKYLCAAGGGALLDLHGVYLQAIKRLEDETSERSPFSDIQAAIGIVQTRRIRDFANSRSAIAERYLTAAPEASSERLRKSCDAPWRSMFRMPFETAQPFEQVQRRFAESGIALRRGVDQLAHRAAGLSDEGFPNAVQAFNRTVSPPFYPALSEGEIEQIAAALRSLR